MSSESSAHCSMVRPGNGIAVRHGGLPSNIVSTNPRPMKWKSPESSALVRCGALMHCGSLNFRFRTIDQRLVFKQGRGAVSSPYCDSNENRGELRADLPVRPMTRLGIFPYGHRIGEVERSYGSPGPMTRDFGGTWKFWQLAEKTRLNV